MEKSSVIGLPDEDTFEFDRTFQLRSIELDIVHCTQRKEFHPFDRLDPIFFEWKFSLHSAL